MKLAEMVDQINKAFLDALIEKMDKLMNTGGFDLDGDVLIFWVKEDEDYYSEDNACIPFNMMKLRAGDIGEIGTAISIISKIESGEYDVMLTYHGGVDLSGIFE